MITTKGVEVECDDCRPVVYAIASHAGKYRRHNCPHCNGTGQKTIPIPVEYQEEVERLLEIIEDCPGFVNQCSCGYAQTRLKEIELLIIKNSKA